MLVLQCKDCINEATVQVRIGLRNAALSLRIVAEEALSLGSAFFIAFYLRRMPIVAQL